jgi:hypothetical protein
MTRWVYLATGAPAPIGLCCLAAVLQSVVPLWVTVALIVPALVLMAVRLAQLNAEWQDVNEALATLERWRRERERNG